VPLSADQWLDERLGNVRRYAGLAAGLGSGLVLQTSLEGPPAAGARL